MKKCRMGSVLVVIVFCIMLSVSCRKEATTSKMEVASEAPSPETTPTLAEEVEGVNLEPMLEPAKQTGVEREKPSESIRVSDTIAYVKSDGIYTMKYGETPKRVYEGQGIEEVHFSPSGRYVLFLQDGYSMLDVNNGGVTKIEADFSQFVWSPIKDSIFFVEDGSIHEYDAEGGERKRLVENHVGRGYCEEVIVSPDGKALYYLMKGYGNYWVTTTGMNRFDLVKKVEEQLVSAEEYDSHKEDKLKLSEEDDSDKEEIRRSFEEHDYNKVARGWTDLKMSDDGEWIYILGSTETPISWVGEMPVLTGYNLKEDKFYEVNTPYVWPSTALPFKGGKMAFLAPERNSFKYPGNDCIVLYDVETKKTQYLSPEYRIIRDVAISPQKSRIVYVACNEFWNWMSYEASKGGLSLEEKGYALSDANIYVAEINNPFPKEVVGGMENSMNWSLRFLSDDQTVLFIRSNEDDGDSLWSVDVDEGKEKMLVDGISAVPFDVHHGQMER